MSEDDGFDLVREYRDPLQLSRVVPYKEIAAYILVACVLACVLWMRMGTVRTQYTALVSNSPPMVAGGTSPKAEKDQLNARATAVSTFLDKRIRWSGILAEITQTLPKEVRLTGIQGSALMQKKSGRRAKASPATIVLQAECGLGEAGSMPQSLNGLADSLHSLGTVSSHFDSVELGNVHRTRSQDTDAERAAFSVIFTAKTSGAR
jgi:hypothetical protein